jgi:hypothetical protein
MNKKAYLHSCFDDISIKESLYDSLHNSDYLNYQYENGKVVNIIFTKRQGMHKMMDYCPFCRKRLPYGNPSPNILKKIKKSIILFIGGGL